MIEKWNYTKELILLHVSYDYHKNKMIQISEKIQKLKMDNHKELLKLGNKWLKKNGVKITHGSGEE